MGYGSSSRYEETYNQTRALYSDDQAERARAEAERASRIEAARRQAEAEQARRQAKPLEAPTMVTERRLAQMVVEEPPKTARRAYTLLFDNTYSNRLIAEAARAGFERITGRLRGLQRTATVASVWHSDHGDGDDMIQETNWMTLDDQGERVFLAGISEVRSGLGDDLPEASECALHHVAQYRFGTIPRSHRHLIFVTDQVAHGMGSPYGDNGCPYGRDWRASLREVAKTYGTFEVIACGHDSKTFNLQKQFIQTPGRLAYDLVDLASADPQELTHEERLRLVIPTVLFLMARSISKQAVERYLMALYEEWLAAKQYGSDTDPRARRQIGQFTEYLEIGDAERAQLLEKIFGKPPSPPPT